MSSFFFNFSVKAEEASSSALQGENSGKDDDENSGVSPRRISPELELESKDGRSKFLHSCAIEVAIKDWHREILSRLHTSPCLYSIPISGVKLRYVDSSSVSEIIAASHGADCPSGLELKSVLGLSDFHHSDLIPGLYEGGLKTWECTFDLVAFLAEASVNLCGKTVLELGCGTGLPAIFSVISGAQTVHFQDYNSEVLDYVTIPSLLCNSEKFEQRLLTEKKCRFYSGDWNQLPSLLNSEQCYDIILTSETIYSPSSQPRLLSVLRAVSRVSTGIVFVAAKCVYFGVGGTVEGFCKLVEEDGLFDVREVWRVSASVPRVILKLTHKENMTLSGR